MENFSEEAASNHVNPQTHYVLIHVNNKPVQVSAPKASGIEIKEAAIKAGVSIHLDFVLSHEKPNGDTEIVGDNDFITVNSQSRFTALAPDDNSKGGVRHETRDRAGN